MWHSAKAGLLFAALSAALAPAASAAGDGGADAGELLETAHFLRTLNGRPIAVITERRYRVTVDGERSFRTVSETKQRVVVGGHSKKGLASKTVLTDESGRAVALEEKSFDNRAPRRIEVKVTSAGGTSKVEFVTRLPGSAERRTADVAGPVYFDLDGRVMRAAGELKPGGAMTAAVVAAHQAGIARLQARVLGRRTRSSPGEEAYLVEVSNVGGRGTPWQIVCDADGRTLELEVGGLVTRRVPEAEARLPLVATRVSNALPTRPLKGRPLRARKMVLLVEVEKDLSSGVIPPSPGQQAARDPSKPGRYVVVLSERKPDGRLPRAVLSAPDRRAYTASTALIPAEHPQLKAAAEAARGEETEPMVVADRLVRYVSRRLANSPLGASTSSALEAYRRGSGDCTEHSVLLVALARAAGIPARQVSGLVHAGRSFIFHQWAEVHVDDRWVPCDPSKGLLGLPACYLRLGWGSPNDADYRSRALALMGGGRIEIIEAR